MAQLLEGMKGNDSGVYQLSESDDFLGADPELDHFMVSFFSHI